MSRLTDGRRPAVVVLGAGMTGLTVAWQLSKIYPPGSVTLVEREAFPGGLAATLTRHDLVFDTGSHRLHDGYHPEVDALLRDLCGDDLLRRDRHGVIYIEDRPVAYPPSAFDVMGAFGPRRALAFAIDLLGARVRDLVSPSEPESFEDFTIRRVGRRLYESFYRPYALKLYGVPPRGIARDPAISRVRKFSLAAMLRDLGRTVSGHRSRTYLYPKGGIGQLARALEQRVVANGGRILYGAVVEALPLEPAGRVESVALRTADGRTERVPSDLVVSTIPLDALHQLVALDREDEAAAKFDLEWRALRLLHLVVPQRLRGEHETYYFPERHIIFGRVSELRKYSPALNQRHDGSALTIEIPCTPGDDVWAMADEPLARICMTQLQALGLLPGGVDAGWECSSTRLTNVYPVYDLGWRERFERIYSRLDAIENLYMIGRSALFLHCNIDHCMLMAITLTQHLARAAGGKTAWRGIQSAFRRYRVRE